MTKKIENSSSCDSHLVEILDEDQLDYIVMDTSDGDWVSRRDNKGESKVDKNLLFFSEDIKLELHKY